MAQATMISGNGLKLSSDEPTFHLGKPHLSPAAMCPDVPLEAVARSFRHFQKNASPAKGMDFWYLSFPGRREHAQLFRDLHGYDPQAADRLALAMTSMPEVGSEFLGFFLLAELGRGAFGRVYLAQQGELANRPVVLKVAADAWGEVQSLAQLQHPHIVPVYSVHHSEPFLAVCMPFHGSTTLQDVLQEVRKQASPPTSGRTLVQVFRKNPSPFSSDVTSQVPTFNGLSYVEALVWVGTKLADGLAHAHEHGIVHRDLKPANVLLTDEGEPMLLDFNVAEDLKLRAGASVACAAGTLPYMAPEQIAGMGKTPVPVDCRSDVYAFGIVLYELLTGQYPFRRREITLEGVEPILEDRSVPPPPLRRWNRAVSPALQAIVTRCLEFNPDRRYPSARELQEDLECQRSHQPLRHTPEPIGKERLSKWFRRHPRVFTGGLAALGAFVLLAALGIVLMVRNKQLENLHQQDQERTRLQNERETARTSWQQFQEELKTALFLLYTRSTEPEQRIRGMTLASKLINGYKVLENELWQHEPLVQALPAADRQQLGESMGELLLLLARGHLTGEDAPSQDALQKALLMNERAENCSPPAAASPALWRQRAHLNALLGRKAQAKACQSKADSLPLRTAQDYYWLASDHLSAGRIREALPLFQTAAHKEPQNFWAWFVLANCYERLAVDGRAEACYGACIALWPRFHWAHFNRALAFLRQQEYRLACADFDTVIQLQPNLTDAYLNRALARQGLRQFQEAEQDLTEALQRGDSSTRLYFLRARVRGERGDKEGAARDYQEGLRRKPVDEISWLARGFAHLSRDPHAALADFNHALRLNPRSFAGLQNKAHVLAEKLGRTEEALKALNLAVEWYPESTMARGGRGVLLARLGRRAPAIRDAEETLLCDTSPPRLYQVACIYALTSLQQPEDRLRAFQLLSSALRKGYGFDLLEADQDLDPIRNLPEFRRLVDAARSLRPTS